MSSDQTKKRQQRRNDHIAKDLRTPKYRERAIPKVRVEDEEERRERRYGILDNYEATWHPLDSEEEYD